uniref:Uncharacterized protein n=1 Tax=Setaria italica TaxID=4555 RepID=K3ZKH7_SETIT
MLSSAGRHPPQQSCSRSLACSLRMRHTMSSSDMPSLSSIFFSSCLLITSFTLTEPGSTTAAGAFTGSRLVRDSSLPGDDTLRTSLPSTTLMILISFLS